MTNGLHTVANLDFVPHQSLHPSPLDWRDQFIYFLLVAGQCLPVPHRLAAGCA